MVTIKKIMCIRCTKDNYVDIDQKYSDIQQKRDYVYYCTFCKEVLGL